MYSPFRKSVWRLIALGIAPVLEWQAVAASPPTMDARGDVTVPSFTVPFSGYASAASRRMFQRMLEQGRHAPPLNGPVSASRAYYDRINTARADRIDAELHVWDGMWHSFFSDPEMPESKGAYVMMVRFFDRHLDSFAALLHLPRMQR